MFLNDDRTTPAFAKNTKGWATRVDAERAYEELVKPRSAAMYNSVACVAVSVYDR
jgi:hypothetical protein